MNNKKERDKYRTYSIAKHHAWAGSVLLAVVLALRVFSDISEYKINNLVFIIPGLLIVLYILIALILTYRYRKELLANNTPQSSSEKVKTNEIETKLKTQMKIEKKKAKAELKRNKKKE
jgi:Na+/melibiose symporter-like transporter